MDEKAIFFMGFLQCLKEDSSYLFLVEPEGPVVGPADQMIGVDVLNDSQWTSHAMTDASTLPTLIVNS